MQPSGEMTSEILARRWRRLSDVSKFLPYEDSTLFELELRKSVYCTSLLRGSSRWYHGLRTTDLNNPVEFEIRAVWYNDWSDSKHHGRLELA